MIRFTAAVFGIVMMVGAARADCTGPTTDAERARCVGLELMASDQTINDEYHRLHEALDDAGRTALRHQEIAWIKARAATCGIDTKESNREKWFASLLGDFNKTVCVVRFTGQRVAALEAQYAVLSKPAEPAQPMTPAATPSATVEPDIYDIVAQRFPSSGKWYFEVALQRGEIARTNEASIFVGVQGVGFTSVGTLQMIRKRDIGRDGTNIGVALDLDDGNLYMRINGAWQSPPGSVGGLDLKLGRAYIAKLSSSVSLTPYLDRNLVDVNLGQHQFTYALPDGYVPLDPRGPRQIAAPM